MGKRDRRNDVTEPDMSDRTVISSVEDLIRTAFGPANKNTVNFKLIQTILHILARQMRLLEQDVEIKFDEIGIDIRQQADEDKPKQASSSSEDEGAVREKEKGGAKKGEKGKKTERGGKGEKKKDRKSIDAGKHDRKGSLDGIRESGTGITVTEALRTDGKGRTDKILVAERGPASSVHPARVGSIEVVTASQFALLERAVQQLEQYTGPLPMPSLPDNEQLRKDLAKGRASLSDTMQAVQLNARVQATEKGLSRMAELLTQLAMAGALPLDLAFRIKQMQAELNEAELNEAEFNEAAPAGPAGPAAAVGAGKRRGAAATDKGLGTKSLAAQATVGGAEAAGAAQPVQPVLPPPGVTHQEMHDVLEFMKESFTKEMQNLTARANHSADVASNTSRSVALKVDTALQVDARITNLFAQTADYADQLSGFDSGLTTQLTTFHEQITQMKRDLTGGLIQLASANNNAETAAVLDLNERYEGLVIELDNTLQLHQHLSSLQQQLSDELRSLVQCVEMLREQKADRDEVLDGLRDKADMSRLAGLLYEKDFAQARYEIENRLEKCYDKFLKQDQVWETALSDLTVASENKADIITLMALKESATQKLNEILEKLRKLEIMLGEPKAALLMRQLARDAACGACLSCAIMPPKDATYGKPFALPALRPAPLGAEDLCLGEVKPPETRDHTCHRWVGGSHTLVGGNVTRVKAGDLNLQAMPTKKFEGYGTDGKLYMMEEDMQPCAECNKWSTDDPGHQPHSSTPTGGGGDQVRG